jgi:hypothetical protein
MLGDMMVEEKSNGIPTARELRRSGARGCGFTLDAAHGKKDCSSVRSLRAITCLLGLKQPTELPAPARTGSNLRKSNSGAISQTKGGYHWEARDSTVFPVKGSLRHSPWEV